ncbi:MAG: Lrp/AsnC ligand binding domain-containing protein [Bacteroidaceae bacterium]|jgi:Lrp/AsnC family transcriptional regulator for asnA, asnC and gidA|nr:Lrp/AsnC ligand binding domain-containing protein [Bacteroidaceae bacterium]MBR0243165.1 Lrp/AsnC ligand binding domain-containing protein [Bacteroidaceae bacterium]MBR1665064.1 Lrp/AsnC ligand binding domain-containing protein [Bacteroidaceae bacterium]MBR1791544.1 Lrp/AsnC ligand binding domain-containing protein [Bacteroidaceae bacterium]
MIQGTIDQLDQQILELIASDARKPFLEVARQCGVSGAAIHQRIQRLFKLGILKGSQFILDPGKIGYDTCAYVGIYLKEPSDFDRVMEEITKIPEVVECHVTTGGYDMFVKLYARNNAHLMEIIQDKLRPLGLQRTESIISFHEAFIRQMPIPQQQG